MFIASSVANAMRVKWVRVVGALLALCAVFGAGRAPAQPAPSSLGANEPEGPVGGMSEFGAWFGISLNSPAGNLSRRGAMAREFYILVLRYGKVLLAGRELALEYVLDLVPLAVVTEIPRTGQVHYESTRDT